ncbi:methyltransferase [Mycolicibacter sp. MYC123]|uniref:Methyltransferase n=1 Tax=[Mycobacterium] zoologicum TaxID=2872311 RepID=A0ABU5YRT3_9MYCO|nr:MULTISPECIES: acetylserotonin O-methyltransferase [unclassified Mycolicibacter]MEB3051659.1 methyltransferase [Mycolicibacter sp. MYC123]MEB3064534.1 methyltransferase [Mycolicibacter sp. MYC101]
MPKSPPAAVLNAVNAFRGGLQRLRQATVPASVAVMELGFGGWLTQAMVTAVQLGIPDALKAGPLTAEDVARTAGSDPAATYRLMRALASQSVFRLRQDGRFALTRTGRALVSDGPGSVASMIAFIGHPRHREHWSHLQHSVRTGETAVAKLRGMPFFEYLDTDPELAQVFNDAMTGASTVAIESAVPAYDFSTSKLIVDVGGGHGALLAAVLRQAPQARGVLFDLPQVVAGAGTAVADVASRCDIQGGSFFESIPPDGDTYLLKTVIHDWDDEKSLAILRNIRSVIAPHGKVLLIEMVLPDGAPAHPGFLLDLEMLVAGSGQERTEREYAELLAKAGFELRRVVPTTGPMSIVEARAV